MAKLYTEMRNEKGTEYHSTGNRQICANFFYGSREQSIKAVTVCATIEPEDPKTVKVTALFVSRTGEPLQYFEQSYAMPQPKPVVTMVI